MDTTFGSRTLIWKRLRHLTGNFASRKYLENNQKEVKSTQGLIKNINCSIICNVETNYISNNGAWLNKFWSILMTDYHDATIKLL